MDNKLKKIPSHTNESFKYKKNKKIYFYQIKIYNGFNHLIDYNILKKLPFVPKLIKNTTKDLTWEYEKGKNPSKLNKEQMSVLAKNLRILHNSELPFPEFNLKTRIKSYIKQLDEKGKTIFLINEKWDLINKIIDDMDKATPMHGDMWSQNLIWNKEEMFIIDWEYATLGDIHFDLAYIILSFRMNKEDEILFLEKYFDYEESRLVNAKLLVLYYIILWINVQDKKLFDDEEFIKKFKEIEALPF